LKAFWQRTVSAWKDQTHLKTAAGQCGASILRQERLCGATWRDRLVAA
jgi:hypothetical protein